MEFPLEVRQTLEKELEGYGQARLKQAARDLSLRYREGAGTGRHFGSLEAAAYAAARMPATFGAVADALGYALEGGTEAYASLLDAGAGSGAASWAAAGLLPLKRVVCLEREEEMAKLGKRLMREGPSVLRTARWIEADLTRTKLPEKMDLVIAAYVLNELPEEQREAAAENLWAAAGRMLLLVEPGTPTGFSILNAVRKRLLAGGAHMAAPCPHEEPCRLSASDWCHFTSRIQRSRLHKLLKGGDAPYEDEKYAYLAFVREKRTQTRPEEGRILRHPQIGKGQIGLSVCTAWENRTICIRKRDGSFFKEARKAGCGDRIALPPSG